MFYMENTISLQNRRNKEFNCRNMKTGTSTVLPSIKKQIKKAIFLSYVQILEINFSAGNLFEKSSLLETITK